jgi:rhodanese-related sulfurtransferase
MTKSIILRKDSSNLSFILLLLFIAGFVMTIGAVGAESGQYISGQIAHERSIANTLTIIDVRTPNEWRQTGLPKNAEGATIYRDNNKDFLAQISRITNGDKAAPIALICASGVRSARAADILKTAGYRNVLDIKGGMMGNQQNPGWMAQNLPIQPCSKC